MVALLDFVLTSSTNLFIFIHLQSQGYTYTGPDGSKRIKISRLSSSWEEDWVGGDKKRISFWILKSTKCSKHKTKKKHATEDAPLARPSNHPAVRLASSPAPMALFTNCAPLICKSQSRNNLDSYFPFSSNSKFSLFECGWAHVVLKWKHISNPKNKRTSVRLLEIRRFSFSRH